jgi:hypothetical protein
MSSFPMRVLILVALVGLPFTAAPALAQRGEPSTQDESSSAAPSTEEERWAAEREPSQLEPQEEQSSESAAIHADALLALRGAYGVPGGRFAEDGSDVSDAIAGLAAVELDIGALLENGLYLGVYGQYGFGVLGSEIADACDEARRVQPGTDISCSASAIRGGVALEYHHGAGKKRKPVDPWLGVGTGLEHVSWQVAAQDAASAATLTQSATGFEYISGHLGVDFAVADWFAMGPYLSFTVGSYGSVDLSCEGDCAGVPDASSDIANTSVHTWSFFGVRASFQIDASAPSEPAQPE